jgi:hypothetical protein
LIAAFDVIPAGLTIPPLLLVLLGSCLQVWGFFRFASKRVKPVPAATIGDVQLGQVEVHGIATAPYSITAPVSGKPCYLYRATVWQQKKTATHTWEKLAEETLHVPFFLNDSTGQLLIEPIGADLEIPISLREEYGGSAFFNVDTIPPAINLFLARHRVTPTKRFLIEESCIEPQTEVFAAGTVTDNPGVKVRPLAPRDGRDRQPESVFPEIIRLSDASAPLQSGEMSQQSRIAAALTKAGITNPSAWAVAGVPYPDSASSSATAVLAEEHGAPVENPDSNGGFDLKPPVVLMKGAGNRPFVLSSRSTRHPKSAPSWGAAILLGIGAAFTAVGFWSLLSKMHLL